eukprot:TRINITY_DN30220_c0_g1_i1.p1 TRINITY_DN30220_c0_g1~~TRINITY_DN30220_c0_g1_i1.p1  ORF type:complete len:399 (-),score=127.53 TRINITY_DN30220_c0_g1_i1:91-1263(-)
MAAPVTEDLSAFDEEEPEIVGNLTFRPAYEILPKTKRTELLEAKKIEDLKRKKQEAEEAKKRREHEDAMRKKQEQHARKQQIAREHERRVQEQKIREEMESRKKMEGALDQILDSLHKNTSPPHITACGIELESVRLRLLTKALENNTSCMSLDLNRKGLEDEDGVSLALMLEKNKHLQKLECEGNNLGVLAAKAIGEALKKNQTLRCLNLESNNLTASGNDQMGIIELASSLKENRALRVLMLSKNGLANEAGECLEKAIEVNESLTLVDLSGSDPSLRVEQLRRIDATVQRNRERQSAIRRAERRERFALYNEEFKCRQYCMQVEAMRLEIEAHEERRLNRMKARFKRWVQETKETAEKEKLKFEELMSEAADRAETNKTRRGGKKKK